MMGKGMVHKVFIYFLCLSFLLLTGGFPRMAAEANEPGLPIGQMISSGEVKFEAREDVWKEVEPSHFPIFQGVRIKTEKGSAFIVLPDATQIQVSQNSLFSFQHDKRVHLYRGGVSFHIPSNAEMSFAVGELSIGKSLSLHAAKGPISPGSEETIGAITLHSNGSVTVKNIRGGLSVRDQHHAVLATVPSRESVTIPSATVSGVQRRMVAQVGEYPTGKAVSPEPLFGLSKTTWMWIGLGAVAAAGAGIAIAAAEEDDDEFIVPLCP